MLLSPLLFTIHTDDSFELPKVLLLRAAVIVSLAIAAARLLSHGAARNARRVLREAGRDPIMWGVAALLAAGALSSALSLSPRVSFAGERTSFAGFTTLACYAALFAATRSAASSADARCALLWAAFLGAVGASAYALVQRLGLDPIAWSRPDWDPRRVWGPLGNPTFLSDHLVSVLPVALYLTLRAWRAGRRAAACAVAAGSAWIGFAAVLTFSRSGVLAMGVSLPALALGWRRIGERAGARSLAIASGGAIAVALLSALHEPGGLDSTWARLSRLPVIQQEARVEIWRAAVRMVADHPWTGVGLDAFHLAFPAYRTVRYWELEWGLTPTRAHNELLHVAATQGIAGLAGLALLIWAIGITWLRALRHSDALCDRARVVALGCSLLAIAVRSLFGLTVAAQGVLIATYAGLLSAESKKREPSAYPGPRVQRTLGAVAVVAWFVFVETILASGPTPRLVGAISSSALWLLGPLLAFAFVAGRVERTPVAHPERRRASPLEIAVWPAAALAVYYFVWLPFTADVLCRNGWSRLRSGQLERAAVQLQQAVHVAPHADYYWRQLGLLQEWRAERASNRPLRLELLRSAHRAHARASALVPANPYHRADVARSLAALASVSGSGVSANEALDAYRNALSLDPRNPLVWNDAARAALRLGGTDTAEGFARESLSLHSGEGEPRAILGRAARERGDLEHAEHELSAATSAEWRGLRVPEIAAWEDLARVRADLGRPDQAIAAWREVLRLAPTHSEAHVEIQRLVSSAIPST